MDYATLSTKLDVSTVDTLISEITSRNLYAVAKIPAFRERYFFLASNSNTTCGFAQKGKGYLWSDEEKCYWMDPRDTKTLSWLRSIVDELKGLGFDEVVFSEFRIPNTTQISYSGDSAADLKTAAQDLVTTCATESFAVSFMTSDTTFPLPDGRCRIYLENVSAKNVDAIAAQMGLENPEVQLVFVSTTSDTRFDAYSVVRPNTISTMNQ